MRCANSCTSLDCALDFASLPASISTWFAVTTIAAICGSLGALPWAQAALTPRAHSSAADVTVILLIHTPSGNDVWAGRLAAASFAAAHEIRCHEAQICFRASRRRQLQSGAQLQRRAAGGGRRAAGGGRRGGPDRRSNRGVVVQ